MTGAARIAATGIHLPRRELRAGDVPAGAAHEMAGEAIRVPGADEDPLTMAIAAGQEALDVAAAVDVDAEDVVSLGVASTTPPVEGETFLSRAVRALGLADDVRTDAATQDPASGADLLERAASTAVSDGPALAIAADAPEGGEIDATRGGGAVAFLFVPAEHEGVPASAATLTATGRFADEYPGIEFRTRGERAVDSLDITTYEREAIVTCLDGAVADLALQETAVEGLALYQPTARMAHRASAALPFDDVAHEAVVADRVGDLGAATVPLALLVALADAGADETTIGGFFASGARCVALAFEGGVDAAVDDRLNTGSPLSYAEYVRLAGLAESDPVAGGGAHVSVPSWRRTLDARYRLVAGQCPDCGKLTFPAEGACTHCGSRSEFDRVELPREGVVATATAIGDGNAPPEFAPQQRREGPLGVVIVDLDVDGEAVQVPAQMTDCEPNDVSIGDPVRATIRRIYTQEGVTRYGVKFTPV